MRHFGFNIANRSRNGEPARKGSPRPDHQLDAALSIGDITLILVYFASILLDPRLLVVIFRFVVFRKSEDALAPVSHQESPGIAHIADIADIADDQGDDRAAARTVDLACFLHSLHLRELIEHAFRLSDAPLHRFCGVSWETALFYYQLVQLVSQEIRTVGASVTVVDAEERTARPGLGRFALGLQDVQDY